MKLVRERNGIRFESRIIRRSDLTDIRMGHRRARWNGDFLLRHLKNRFHEV